VQIIMIKSLNKKWNWDRAKGSGDHRLMLVGWQNGITSRTTSGQCLDRTGSRCSSWNMPLTWLLN